MSDPYVYVVCSPIIYRWPEISENVDTFRLQRPEISENVDTFRQRPAGNMSKRLFWHARCKTHKGLHGILEEPTNTGFWAY